jgi:hypothetical protein
MLKNKKMLAIISAADSVLFFGINILISNYVSTNSGYNWAFLIESILPLLGAIFSVYVLIRVQKYWKILPLLGFIANGIIFAIAFLVYSFSYWQF